MPSLCGGPEHPKVATRQSNLAHVLQDLGELTGASDLAQKAYGSLLKKFGADHPNTRHEGGLAPS
ncbi:MAG: tetratricopeptide repeat protein [Deltaproteobacteria bacterium]|nr:tetratricopeptide repeat protein [Deltaproteobacteria bacterium]